MSGSWPVKRLPEIADLSSPSFLSIDDETEYPMVPMACIDEVSGLNTTYEKVRGEDLKGSRTKFLPGDILFAKITPCVENGKISLAPAIDAPIGFATTEVYRIGPGPEIDQRYLLHFLRSPNVRRAAEASMTGSTGRQRVPRAFFKSLEVPVPPLNEQRRIADLLGRLDRGSRSIAEDSLELSVDLGNLLPATLARGLRELRAEHPERPLGELAGFRGGGTPSKRVAAYWQGEIPWVSPKDMKTWEIVDSIDHITEEAIESSGAKWIDAGAVLLVVRGMILAHTLPVAISRKSLTINQDMKALVPRPGYLSEYLAYALLASERHVLDSVQTASHGTRRLPTEVLRSLYIPAPPLLEQRLFVNRVEAVREKAKSLAEQSLESRRLLESAISSALEKAFEGRL